jgi:hypothetical protein
MPTACSNSVLDSPEWGIRHERATRLELTKLVTEPRRGDTAVDSDKESSDERPLFAVHRVRKTRFGGIFT